MVTYPKGNIVYVVGAGLSAGLGFPTIQGLLPAIWSRLKKRGLATGLASIIRFNHPSFNASVPDSWPNIEQLLSEMQANEQLFEASRPAIGTFKTTDLIEHREELLLELANWFHELQAKALEKRPLWLNELANDIRNTGAQVISFNWDLVLDELLFGSDLKKESYGFGLSKSGPRLLKPHGSLNWYAEETGRHIKNEKKFLLSEEGSENIFAFKEYRAPLSKKRAYMPLIVPPVYSKQFQGELFKHIWRETVSVLSDASEVRFVGYSLAPADFHARFILRCGFYAQETGKPKLDGMRSAPTGRAKVMIIDPLKVSFENIQGAVGWSCNWYEGKAQDWIMENLSL